MYARRALALAPPLSPETFGELRLLLPMASVIPALKSFVGGDPKPFFKALQRLESHADPSFKTGLFSYYLALGQIRKAESLAGFQSNPVSRGYFAVDLAYSLGRAEAFREELRRAWKKKPLHWALYTAMLARACLVAEADSEWKLVADLPLFDPAVKDALRGLLALVHGNTEAADGLIDSALGCPLSFGGVYLLAAEAEAESLQKRGRAAEASGILERALSHRGEIAGFSYFAWRLEVRLSRLYRKLGRVEEARAAENRLLSRLSLADPDHPAVLAVRDGKPWLEP